MIRDSSPAATTRGTLPAGAGPVLLAIARQSITVALVDERGAGRAARRARMAPRPNAQGGRPTRRAWLDEPGATFVTLTASEGADLAGTGLDTTGTRRLRGCIGTLEPRLPLRADVAANAVAAATRDRRFPPVTADELPRIAIEVCVLSPAAPLPVADEAEALARLRPGVDGVVLACDGRRATFLPQVWDKLPHPRDFLVHLKAKAGFPRDFWSDHIALSTYTVTQFHDPEPLHGDHDHGDHADHDHGDHSHGRAG